jgi:hypothetical protein
MILQVTLVHLDGQNYHVIWLDASTPFDPQAGSLKSPGWREIRAALDAQEMDLPSTPPKHLVISADLVELLGTETWNIELWVMQRTDRCFFLRSSRRNSDEVNETAGNP